MIIAIDKTVRELALENPASTRVFESFGIDYCCGGSRSLSEACLSADLSIDEVLESLAKTGEADLARHDQRDWQTEPLAALIEHIQSTHHKYTRLSKPIFISIFIWKTTSCFRARLPSKKGASRKHYRAFFWNS